MKFDSSLTLGAFDFAAVDHLTRARTGVFDVACPRCGPVRHAPGNRVRRVLRIWRHDPDFASYLCARCGLSGWAKAPRGFRRRPFLSRLPGEAKAPKEAAGRITLALQLWHAASPIGRTPAWRYLTERRALAIDGLDLGHALRWHPGIGALLALMTDPATGEASGIHRTFLAADGSKRERKMLGRQGVVRLSPDEDVTGALGICEGIEDGLAALASGWGPVWSATSAGGVARFPVLPGIEHLTILADDDDVGMDAAENAAARWRNAGRETLIASPDGID